MAITLDATNDSIEFVTGAAVSLDYVASWVDEDGTAFTPGDSQGNVATATTTTVVAAPASATRRGLKHLCLTNRGTAAQTVAVYKRAVSTQYALFPGITLAAGESLQFCDGAGWAVFDSAGRTKRAPTETTGYSGRAVSFHKVGTAAEAAGQWYCHAKDTGSPGAWAPGTPGLAGRATDGTAAADAGCLPWQNPASGGMYLTQHWRVSSVAHTHLLMDCLWVNSGVVVTTTTAQTINSVAWPARDLYGSTNGDGVMVGILVTTATTNAGAITNTTLSYTNQAGTAGRTATMASFPATAVAGTVVWFQLQAGDTGVRSIQSVTLGTSYAGGAVSLIAVRWVSVAPCVAANVASAGDRLPDNPGTRLWNNSCLLLAYLASATTATTTAGLITLMER